MMNQELTKALNDLEFLVRDLSDAHKAAIAQNPLGAFAILDALVNAQGLKGRVALMVEATKEVEE